MVRGFLLIKGQCKKFDVPGSVQTLPIGINDAGQIVGWYTGSDFVLHGFLAQPEHKSKAPGQ